MNARKRIFFTRRSSDSSYKIRRSKALIASRSLRELRNYRTALVCDNCKHCQIIRWHDWSEHYCTYGYYDMAIMKGPNYHFLSRYGINDAHVKSIHYNYHDNRTLFEIRRFVEATGTCDHWTPNKSD